MALEVVTDIQVFLDRQDATSRIACAPLLAHPLSTPEDPEKYGGQRVHFHPDPTDILHTHNTGEAARKSMGIMCSECNCPTVVVECISTGDDVRICRDFLSAIKLDSVSHRGRDHSICLRCKIKYNPNGVVAGAIHMEVVVEDWTDDEGIVRLGFRSRLALGKVKLDAETGEIEIET